MSEELINKYRPTSFDDVIGHDSVVRSIKAALDGKRGRSFILGGPSGVGKTTLARIIAKHVGAKAFDIVEIDGATHTGIDAMRGITERLQYKSFGGGARAVIVDEAHSISKPAVRSLLKAIEEPPDGVYWLLCTTEPASIPKEIRTRCLSYDLKPVPDEDILALLMGVTKAEGLPIANSDEALTVLVEAADGSPRQALSFLAECGHTKDLSEIRILIKQAAVASKEAIDLCRLLIKGASWKELTACIAKLDGQPESVRIIVLRYMSSVALKEGKPGRALAIMDAFAQPFQDREGTAPLILACGGLCFGE